MTRLEKPFSSVVVTYRHSLVNPIYPLEMDVEENFFSLNDGHDPVQAIIETNSNVEGVVMTKVYSNKEKKSVTSMRDFDAADLEKFPGVASNSSMAKKEIPGNKQLWSEIQLNLRIVNKLKSKANIKAKEKPS